MIYIYIYITGQVRRTSLSLGDKLGIGIKEDLIRSKSLEFGHNLMNNFLPSH
jgi:hypothetical protein